MEQYTVTQLIKMINNRFRMQVASHLKNRIITKTQAEILYYIREKNDHNIEVNQKDIQVKFHLTNPTVTGVLNRLEEKNLVSRRVSEKSARCNRLMITDSGREELLEGANIIAQLEKEFLSCLSSEEQKNLSKLLLKLFHENLEEGESL